MISIGSIYRYADSSREWHKLILARDDLVALTTSRSEDTGWKWLHLGTCCKCYYATDSLSIIKSLFVYHGHYEIAKSDKGRHKFDLPLRFPIGMNWDNNKLDDFRFTNFKAENGSLVYLGDLISFSGLEQYILYCEVKHVLKRIGEFSIDRNAQKDVFEQIHQHILENETKFNLNAPYFIHRLGIEGNGLPSYHVTEVSSPIAIIS